MGAAVTVKSRLSCSIFLTFLFGLICIILAFCLSWSNKPNVSYFILASLIFSMLGANLCTEKKVTFSGFISILRLLLQK